MPDWFLLLAFWFHMLVTVVWLGTLGASSFLLLPNLKKSLSPEQMRAWMLTSTRRLIIVSWIGISLLTVSGLFQMADNTNYEGFLSVGNLWSAAILGKHLIFLVMVLLTGLLTWNYLPGLERQILLAKAGQAKSEAPHTEKIERVVRANFWLGVLTLALTALARIS